MSTFVLGHDFRISPMASEPLSPGMEMSSTTTSGGLFSTIWMAVAPFCASPITSMSGSASSNIRSPARSTAWSSTMSTCMAMAQILRRFPNHPMPYRAYAVGRDLSIGTIVDSTRP